jgi:hypothetical protein
MPKKKRIGQPKKQRPRPAARAKNQKEDSDDIERAVYDGMQDLRVKKYLGT